MYFTQWRKVWFAKWIVKWWAPWKPRCLKWYTVRRILSRHRNRCSSARHARAPQPISHRRIPRPPRPFGFSPIPARRHGTSPSLSRWRAMASSSSSPAPALAGEALRQKRILSSKLYLEVPSSKVGRGHRPISSFQDTRELSLSQSNVFLQAPVVYSPAYDISFLGLEKLWAAFPPVHHLCRNTHRRSNVFDTACVCRHPFESAKWGRICRYLTREGYLDKKQMVEPLEACKEDLLVVINQESGIWFSPGSDFIVYLVWWIPCMAWLTRCTRRRIWTVSNAASEFPPL